MDGDWRTNPQVRKGFQQLMEEIRNLKATPIAIDLAGQPREKIDDLCLHWLEQELDPREEFEKLPRLDYLVEWGEPLDLFDRW